MKRRVSSVCTDSGGQVAILQRYKRSAKTVSMIPGCRSGAHNGKVVRPASLITNLVPCLVYKKTR